MGSTQSEKEKEKKERKSKEKPIGSPPNIYHTHTA
jgi:hypothetical protein